VTEAAPARAWRVVLDRIETDLLDGILTPGDHLPPERELAVTLSARHGQAAERPRLKYHPLLPSLPLAS